MASVRVPRRANKTDKRVVDRCDEFLFKLRNYRGRWFSIHSGTIAEFCLFCELCEDPDAYFPDPILKDYFFSHWKILEQELRTVDFQKTIKVHVDFLALVLIVSRSIAKSKDEAIAKL